MQSYLLDPLLHHYRSMPSIMSAVGTANVYFNLTVGICIFAALFAVLIWKQKRGVNPQHKANQMGFMSYLSDLMIRERFKQ